MNSPLLQARGLTRSFEQGGSRTQVLAGVDLDLAPGECVVVTGPSGCGKSTLLHLLALLDAPSSGELQWQGRAVSSWSERERCRFRAEQLGLVFQQFHLLPHRTLLENLLLRGRYCSQPPPRAQALALLERIELDHRAHHAARLLSGGEQQRLCIARALLLPPLLMLADEPTGNLGDAHSRIVRDLFSEVHREGQTLLIATHDVAWLPLADRVLTLRGGRLES